MQNLSKLFLYSSLAANVFASVAVHADTRNDQIDITNVARVAGVDYRMLDEYLQCMLQNPYASPDYLYQQLENISKFCGYLTGKQYHLPSMIKAYDQEVKRVCGHHVKGDWLKSLQKYADKRDAVYNYHNYCAVDDDFDLCDKYQQFLDVSNRGVFVFAHTDYDYERLQTDIKMNQGVAPWWIESVPPTITASVVIWASGRLLATVASSEVVIVGSVLQALGIKMGVEYIVHDFQKEWDAKQAKNNPADLRQGQCDLKYK